MVLAEALGMNYEDTTQAAFLQFVLGFAQDVHLLRGYYEQVHKA